jgi:predicted transcriptional regulator
MKKGELLNEKETIVMNLVWSSLEPMTSVELLRHPSIREWNEASLYRTLKSLLKKGFLEVCGMAQYKTQYAREFKAILTLEEYLVRFVRNQDRKRGVLSHFALALAKDETQEGLEDMINELEQVIGELQVEQQKDGN